MLGFGDHHILAMRAHRAWPNDGRMKPALYVIRIHGQLGATLPSAFPAMAPERQGEVTVLTGMLDQPAPDGAWLRSGARRRPG